MSTNSPKPRLLIVSYRFPPETYPLAIGLTGVIDHLRRKWEIDVVTAADDAYEPSGVHIKHVRPRSLSTLQRRLRKIRMDKIARLLLFPDPFWPWIRPALRCAIKAHAAQPYDAVLTFVMPFSGGFVGAALKKRTGLPLVINLDDSPTCTDMNPRFPSRLHYRFARWMEDYFVRTADRVVYVSRHNRDRVRARQPSAYRDRLHLIRCGAQPFSDARPEPDLDTYPSSFRIVYTGAMSGWYAHDRRPQTWLQSLYRAWNRIGTYEAAPVDPRSHSPIYIGKAIQHVVKANPEWQGRIRLDVYGNTYPDEIVNRVLDRYGLQDIVHLRDRIPHECVQEKIQHADLLFLTLPDRLDGSPGGRVSLKTYEYLMTDRPILAAVPPGENHDFLSSKPGTFLSDPTDVHRMSHNIESLVKRWFKREPISFSRSHLQRELSVSHRALRLAGLVNEVSGRHSHSGPLKTSVAH
jgi:glycosyltransferase involved in cell wall biosynthesis